MGFRAGSKKNGLFRSAIAERIAPQRQPSSQNPGSGYYPDSAYRNNQSASLKAEDEIIQILKNWKYTPQPNQNGRVFIHIPPSAKFIEAVKQKLIAITLHGEQTKYIKAYRVDFESSFISIEMRGDFKWEI